MRLVVDQGGKIDPDLKQIVEAGVRGKHVGQRLFRQHGSMAWNFRFKRCILWWVLTPDWKDQPLKDPATSLHGNASVLAFAVVLQSLINGSMLLLGVFSSCTVTSFVANIMLQRSCIMRYQLIEP